MYQTSIRDDNSNDSFEADILGAKAIGMQTLFYNYRKIETPENQMVVKNLIEIKKYI